MKQQLKPMSNHEIMKNLRELDKQSGDSVTFQKIFKEYVSEVYDLATVDTKQLMLTVDSMVKKRTSKRHSLLMILLKGK